MGIGRTVTNQFSYSVSCGCEPDFYRYSVVQPQMFIIVAVTCHVLTSAVVDAAVN
jgi:hypothetical protein